MGRVTHRYAFFKSWALASITDFYKSTGERRTLFYNRKKL